MKRVLALAAGAMLIGVASAHALRLPAAPKCSVFPASNAWNARVDALPVAANSAQMIESIGVGVGLHPDFGSGLYDGRPIGIPFDVVSKKTPRSKVSFDYADESDRVPYPIPANVHIEGGRQSDGDRHALLLDKDACKLYELFALNPRRGGGWHAGSGAVWNLRSNALGPRAGRRPTRRACRSSPASRATTRSRAGVIDHALRFTASRTRRAYVYPARHYASSSDDPRCRRWACACA